MKKLYLAFLWHMHQPYYKDHHANATLMPWVFLHAIKDYYDIPWYLSKYPDIKATFNLVPSLLEQIQGYIDDRANDRLLTTLKFDIASLNQNDLAFLESYLFSSNEDNMIKPLPRYYELYLKYKSDGGSIKNFSHNEILDTQVLFLLSWCGNYLRENSSVVKQLLLQTRDFDPLHKIELIDTLLNFLGEIIPFYKKFLQSGQIAISTTPYYHPILPLLIERKSAKEARGDVILPQTEASYQEFAKMNLEKSITLFEDIFDQKPKGIWPSEGSVSLKTLDLLAQYNIQWSASDETILFNTLKSTQRSDLYRPYRYKSKLDEPLNLFFRDRYLSDLIGFEYSKKDPKEAATHFVEHLKSLYLNTQDSILVPVILDGENAWEFYPNNAKAFFDNLYKLLEEQEWCETILFDEVDHYKDLHTESLKTIASGSWINGNFDIWVGDKDKNRAWELLDETKNLYDQIKNSLDDKRRDAIEKEFLIALGSDWFWWYGDDHYTSFAAQFDEQFRGHLKNIYTLMDQPVPHSIHKPIVQKSKNQSFHTLPLDYISPNIDGQMGSFYEWLNSGYIDFRRELSTMSTTLFIEELLYGKDREDSFYLLFKGSRVQTLSHDTLLRLYINEQCFELPIHKGIFETTLNKKIVTIGYNEFIELKIEKCASQKVNFAFELLINKKEEQKSPLYEDVTLYCENFSLKKWYV
ncbi:MAG: glycoside hydrolase family 57 protein [Campylobacterota bacterium]|nr:glycoside hydrolase family 57 protein [Campylobacterota bacterium]